MSSTTNYLVERNLISPPLWLRDNVHYEVITGSVAYGVSQDKSDFDVAGFCLPPKEYLFPHLAGVIEGFDIQVPRFEQFQAHHVADKDALAGKGRNYDITIYSIAKFFSLCRDCNPNMVDLLFVPLNCILHITQVGNLVRENRKLFLHKGVYHKFKGYAFSMLSKISNKSRSELFEYADEHGIPRKTTLTEVEDEIAKRYAKEKGDTG